MKTRRFAIAASLIAALATPALPAAAQTNEDRAAARAAADAGGEAFEAGRYDEAADLFTRAERLMHAPPHLLFAARSLTKLGRYVEAREMYLQLLQERLSPNAPKAFRDAVSAGDKELDEVEAKLAYVSVVVQGTGAKEVRVLRDGKPMPSELVGVPHPVDPGKHEYQAYAEGMESAPTTVQLKEGVRETVVLTLNRVEGEAPAAGDSSKPAQGSTSSGSLSSDAKLDAGTSNSGLSGMKIGAFVGFGVAAVGAGLGTYFLIKRNDADSKGDAAYQACGGKSCPEDKSSTWKDLDEEAATNGTLALTSYIVAGVGLGTGITLLVLDSNKASDEASTGVRPVVGLGYAGLSGKF